VEFRNLIVEFRNLIVEFRNLIVDLQIILRNLESKETADYKSEEGKDDVKSSCPLHPGLHTCYIGQNKKMQICED